MRITAVYFLLFSLLLSQNIFGQKRQIDSLKNLLKGKLHDTTRCALLDKIIEAQQGGEWEKTNEDLKALSKARSSCRENDIVCRTFKKYYVHSLINLGYSKRLKGENQTALAIYDSAAQICESFNYKKGMATCFLHKGNIMESLGNIPKAIEHYSDALSISENIHDQLGQAYALNNIGLVYRNQGDLIKALEYYLRSLEIKKMLGDKNGISVSLNNIAMIYMNIGDPACKGNKDSCKMNGIKKSLQLNLESLKIREENGDLWGQAFSYSNLGNLYEAYGDPDCGNSEDCKKLGRKKAMEFYLKSLELRKKISDKRGLAQSLLSIGTLYHNEGKSDIALGYAQESMKLSRELGFPENIRNTANTLVAIYRKKGNYKLALENYEIWLQMRDSLKSIANRKASIRSQLKYDFDKKAAADSVAYVKEKEVTNAKLQMQSSELKAKRNQQYALFGGLALLVIFALFMFNRYQLTRKQKNIIEQQKKIVEEKQREVTDSIIYARRIQKAQLPGEGYFDRQLKKLNGKSKN